MFILEIATRLLKVLKWITSNRRLLSSSNIGSRQFVPQKGKRKWLLQSKRNIFWGVWLRKGIVRKIMHKTAYFLGFCWKLNFKPSNQTLHLFWITSELFSCHSILFSEAIDLFSVIRILNGTRKPGKVFSPLIWIESGFSVD